MTSIKYQSSNRDADYLPKGKMENLVDDIKKQMNKGDSIRSGGDVLCDFYYGANPFGFANVMTPGKGSPVVRLTAPNQHALSELVHSFNVPYDKARIKE